MGTEDELDGAIDLALDRVREAQEAVGADLARHDLVADDAAKVVHRADDLGQLAGEAADRAAGEGATTDDDG